MYYRTNADWFHFHQSTSQNGAAIPPTVKRFYLLREHRVHGTVTGIEGIRIVNSLEDGLDRLVVSFKDAKVMSLPTMF